MPRPALSLSNRFVEAVDPDAPTAECQSYWCYWNRVYRESTIAGIPRFIEVGTRGTGRGGCDQRGCVNWNGLLNNNRRK